MPRSADPYCPPPAPTALVVGEQPWTVLTVQAMLARAGFEVRCVRPAGGDALATAASVAPRPDVVFLLAPHGRSAFARPGASAAVCEELVPPDCRMDALPVVLVTLDAPTRADLLAAHAVGIWEVWQLPGDAELLLSRCRLWMRGKRALDSARHALHVDPATGLYTPVGLLQRATELVADAERTGGPLACLGLTVEPVALPTSRAGLAGTQGAYEARLVEEAVCALGTHERRESDILGTVGAGGFVLLAPSTSGDGAWRMAARLGERLDAHWERVALAAGSPPGVPAPTPHARWAVVMLDELEAPRRAVDLLARASAGLALAPVA